MPSHKISQVILTLQAKEDLQDILQYTEQTWGASQRRRYASLLGKAIKSLCTTPLLGHKSVVLGRNYRIGYCTWENISLFTKQRKML